MKKVKSLVFRRLTDADFFNINKPPGTESKGGGQSYIDFPTSAVKLRDWRSFLKGVPQSAGKSGPQWNVSLRSLGAETQAQEIKIGQRRDSSVSIRSQKLQSQESNRVYAWKPDLTGFPQPRDPHVRSHVYDLHIYLAKLDDGEYWAGWFQASQPDPVWPVNDSLNRMFIENDGYIEFDGSVLFDNNDPAWPFRIQDDIPTQMAPITSAGQQSSEQEQEESFFDLDEIAAENESPKVKEYIRKTKVRNQKAVKQLKELYNNLCQLSGDKYTFKKTDESYYSEAHHLISLGEGGSDSVYNVVIVSPLIHRMLHYAKVEGLDLTKIKDNKLQIKINGIDYTITWHPDHARLVQAHAIS